MGMGKGASEPVGTGAALLEEGQGCACLEQEWEPCGLYTLTCLPWTAVAELLCHYGVSFLQAGACMWALPSTSLCQEGGAL